MLKIKNTAYSQSLCRSVNGPDAHEQWVSAYWVEDSPEYRLAHIRKKIGRLETARLINVLISDDVLDLWAAKDG